MRHASIFVLAASLTVAVACGSSDSSSSASPPAGSGGTSSGAGTNGAGGAGTAGSAGSSSAGAAGSSTAGAAGSAAAGAAGASGSSATGGSGGAGGGTSQMVSATSGATITAPGITITIPAGALAADTTITINVAPASTAPNPADVASPLFDLGPTGTKFAKPVTLVIDYDATKAPAGKTPVIAFLANAAWTPLADSAAAGGKVTATTTHFTPFAVVWTSSGAGTCSVSGFTACGGDPTGTWSYTDACMTPPSTYDPTNGMCPTASSTFTLMQTGTLTLDAAGNYTQISMQNGVEHITVPKTCFPGYPCSALTMLFQTATNVQDTGTNCTCDKPVKPATMMGSGTYTVSGTQLTPSSSTPLDFCVSGTTLSLRDVEKGFTIVNVATKQ